MYNLELLFYIFSRRVDAAVARAIGEPERAAEILVEIDGTIYLHCWLSANPRDNGLMTAQCKEICALLALYPEYRACVEAGFRGRGEEFAQEQREKEVREAIASQFS